MKRIKFLSMILSINYFCDTFYTIYFFDDQIELIKHKFYLKNNIKFDLLCDLLIIFAYI